MRPAPISELAILMILAFALAACGETKDAAAQPAAVAQPASIYIELFPAGSAEAAGGGRGTLSFQGKYHPLAIAGVSLPATAGLPKVEMVGQVQHLFRLGDIAGTYIAAEGGAAVLGVRPKVAQLANDHGVSLKLLGKQHETDLSLDLNGMQIRLAE